MASSADLENARLRKLSEPDLESELALQIDAVLNSEALRDSSYKNVALVLVEAKRRLGDQFHPYKNLSGDSRRKSCMSNAMLVLPAATAFLTGELEEDVWKQLRFLDSVRWNRVGLASGQMNMGLQILRENPDLEPHSLRAILVNSKDPVKFAREASAKNLAPTEISSRVVAPEIGERTFSDKQSAGAGCGSKSSPPKKITGLDFKFAQDDGLVSDLLRSVASLRKRSKGWSGARKAEISTRLNPAREFLSEIG